MSSIGWTSGSPGDTYARPVTTAQNYRPVLPLMRLGFQLGVAFTFLAGLSLFVFADETDRLFAWTIAVPLTAALIGAFYLLAMVVAAASLTRSEWALVRVGVPGVLVFLWATSLATFLHLDLFHVGEGATSAQVAAWVWLGVYVVDPILITLAYLQQVRQPGSDRPQSDLFPGWYRIVLVASGSGIVVVGVVLFAAPGWADGWWPWPITALTGRMLVAWLMGAGLVLVSMAHENDEARVRPAALPLVAFGGLQLVVLARFSDAFTGTWGRWIFAGSAVVTVAIGLAALRWPTSAAGRGKSGLRNARGSA